MCYSFSLYLFYTIEDLKQTVVGDEVASRIVLNLQWCGIGDELKQSTPQGCGFKSSPVYNSSSLLYHSLKLFVANFLFTEYFQVASQTHHCID